MSRGISFYAMPWLVSLAIHLIWRKSASKTTSAHPSMIGAMRRAKFTRLLSPATTPGTNHTSTECSGGDKTLSKTTGAARHREIGICATGKPSGGETEIRSHDWAAGAKAAVVQHRSIAQATNDSSDRPRRPDRARIVETSPASEASV